MTLNLYPLTSALEEHAFHLRNNTHMLEVVHRELQELNQLLRGQQATTQSATQATTGLIKPQTGNDLPRGYTNSRGPG